MNWDIFARYLLLIEYGTRWWSKWLACQSIRITICSIGFWITIDRTDYYQLYIGLIVFHSSVPPLFRGKNCKTSFPTKVNTFIYPKASISLNHWSGIVLHSLMGKAVVVLMATSEKVFHESFRKDQIPILPFSQISSQAHLCQVLKSKLWPQRREEKKSYISCLIHFR